MSRHESDRGSCGAALSIHSYASAKEFEKRIRRVILNEDAEKILLEK